MIELNLLEKKRPFVLPTVLGINLGEINFKMLGFALLLYYSPQTLVSQIYGSKIAEREEAVSSLTKENAKISASVEKDATVKTQVEAFKLQVKKLEQRSRQVDEILKTRTNPKKILEKIARSLPEDLWLEALDITENNEISIIGGSTSPRAIGEFITAINDSPYFGSSITPNKQESKKQALDGVLTTYEYYELKGKIINYDMRVK